MKQIKFSSLLLTILLFASCATTKIPFTSDIKKEYGISEDGLKKIQYYTSEDILLYKVTDEDNIATADGILLISKRKDCEKVIIKRGTPCVLEKVLSDNVYLFSFEDNKYIAFGNSNGGNYNLLAKDWKNGTGTLKYDNKTYATSNGDVFLTVKVKKLNSLKSKERILKGRKIN